IDDRGSTIEDRPTSDDTIFDLLSSILDPRSSILGPPIHDAFHDRQQFHGLEGFSYMNLEPGDHGADAVFDASIGRERYGRYVPAVIRIHLPHSANQPVEVDGRHLDVSDPSLGTPFFLPLEHLSRPARTAPDLPL